MSNTDKAYKLARGCYQRNLLRGIETLGGSTLRGKARAYSCRYHASALALLARLDAAGVAYRIQRGPRGGYSSAVLVVA